MMSAAHAFIPIAVERTLDSLVGGLVLTALAWTWLRVARRQNSASRFIILFILLIGIAVLPIVGLSWLGNGSATRAETVHSLVTLPANAAEYLFLAWAVVAFAGLLRIAVGFIQLRRIQRSCISVDTVALDARIVSALLESPRPAILCTSDRVSVPTALGFERPARIVIPTWLLDQVSADELHHLALHELAHLRRWDDWSNLVQKVLGALLFFHPAIWWLQSKLSLEREMACDECVLAQTGNPRAYAKSLAAIAERSFVRRTVALAQAAVSRLHDTTLRVSKILAPPTGTTAKTVPLLASIAGVGTLTLAVALFSPNVVSFTAPESPAPLAIATAPAIQKTDFHAEPVLASLPVARPRKTIAKLTPGVALAPHRTAPLLSPGEKIVPAKATNDEHLLSRPAVLVFWQETYDDGSGHVIQRSYWRVVVLNQVPKEQAKTT